MRRPSSPADPSFALLFYPFKLFRPQIGRAKSRSSLEGKKTNQPLKLYKKSEIVGSSRHASTICSFIKKGKKIARTQPTRPIKSK
jgi:hypothetical protein